MVYPKLFIVLIVFSAFLIVFKIYNFKKHKDDTNEQKNTLSNLIISITMICIFVASSYYIYTQLHSIQEMLSHLDIGSSLDYIYTPSNYLYKGHFKMENGKSPLLNDLRRSCRRNMF